MNGRFFTVPFLCSLVVLCSSDIFLNLRASLAPVALVLLLGFASPHPPILSDANYGQPEQNVVDARGVADERAYYYPTTGLLQASRDTQLPRHPWAEMGRRARGDGTRVIVTDSLGMLGFYSGPDKWLVDVYGLVDPLLARQPIPDPLRWRVGHYVRDVPDGYEDTLKSGHNVIADPALARLYDQLALITRGRLLSGSRLEAIWKMHTRRSGD